jgi:hypothetical protein
LDGSAFLELVSLVDWISQTIGPEEKVRHENDCHRAAVEEGT